ncbi:DUF6631 family protein [Raoultella sp. C349492]|uniref:DUF6631 family protein n=1 Tax=Raoultella sp. C349492 TaxID=2970253 RepID=UPI0035C73BA3
MVNELDVLMPDRTLRINGVQVTVHEYTLAEQLQHRKPLKTISEGLTQAMNGAQNAEISIEALYDVLAERWDAVVLAVAISCDRSVEWVSGLVGDDSETLLLTWWGVNASFFTRNAIRPELEKMVRLINNLPTGAGSSVASSTTATGSATSETIPPAS